MPDMLPQALAGWLTIDRVVMMAIVWMAWRFLAKPVRIAAIVLLIAVLAGVVTGADAVALVRSATLATVNVVRELSESVRASVGTEPLVPL